MMLPEYAENSVQLKGTKAPRFCSGSRVDIKQEKLGCPSLRKLEAVYEPGIVCRQ